MAKVTGPLMSVDARGKIANTLVFMYWKGLNTCRQWIKPANPQTQNQGDIRQILGGLGRATRVIEINSPYHVDAVAVAGPQQTFVSALVKFIIDNVMKDGTEFEAEYSAYSGHTAKASFDSSAATLGLADVDIVYRGATNKFTAGMQLYELARYGVLRKNSVSGAFNRAPYTTSLSNWTSTEISALVTDLQAA